MLMVVATDTPGTMVVEPPNLLMVEQVAALVEIVPASVEVQVTVPVALVSCMTSAPEAAVLTELVMLATKPESVPVIETERSTAPRMPVVMATGAKRRRLDFIAKWLDIVVSIPRIVLVSYC